MSSRGKLGIFILLFCFLSLYVDKMRQSDYNKYDKRINAGYCAILVHCRAATAARGRGKTVKIRRNSHYRKWGAAAPKSEDLSNGIFLDIGSLGNRGNGQILRAFFRAHFSSCPAGRFLVLA